VKREFEFMLHVFAGKKSRGGFPPQFPLDKGPSRISLTLERSLPRNLGRVVGAPQAPSLVIDERRSGFMASNFCAVPRQYYEQNIGE
jgi:hypothetical protein